MEAILKYGNETAFFNRLNAIGHPKHDNAEDRHKLRSTVGMFFGDTLTDIYSDKWVRVRMSVKDADKLPPANNPAFALMWRSDEFENDDLLPEPLAEVDNSPDLDDNVTGTRLQRVGGF